MTFPRRLLIEGEDLVLDLRPHWIALVRAVLIALVVAVAWFLLLRNLPDGTTGDVLRWIILGIGVILLIWYAVRDLVEWLTSNFVVTTDRVIHREGFIAKRSMRPRRWISSPR